MLDHHPRALSGKRDLRIDFFRGVALYMILVDHVVGDPISKFTYQRIGFSDAAELFVFLSGVSCAIVYSRVLERRGWAGLLTSIARRTTKICLLPGDLCGRDTPYQRCRRIAGHGFLPRQPVRFV